MVEIPFLAIYLNPFLAFIQRRVTLSSVLESLDIFIRENPPLQHVLMIENEKEYFFCLILQV